MTVKALHTCSVSVGHAAMETRGAAAPSGATWPGMRSQAVQAATPAPSPLQAAVEAYLWGNRRRGPPNFPRRDHLSQEHFLLPHGGRLGAPEAVFAALLPAHQTENQR
jgi:hypothetical protein